MARSKEEMDRWQAFAGLLNKMIKDGHGEKVAIGITGALMGNKGNVESLFEWAEIYFKEEIDAAYQKIMGPRNGETVH